MATTTNISPPIHQLPETGLKFSQSVGDKKTNTPELISIDNTIFLQGVIPFGGSFGYGESTDEQW